MDTALECRAMKPDGHTHHDVTTRAGNVIPLPLKLTECLVTYIPQSHIHFDL